MFLLLLYVAVSSDVLVYGEREKERERERQREREREKWNCFLFVSRLIMIHLFTAIWIRRPLLIYLSK